MNTDMSAFTGLSPNNDLKYGVPGIIYDLYYVILIMNTDYAQIVPAPPAPPAPPGMPG